MEQFTAVARSCRQKKLARRKADANTGSPRTSPRSAASPKKQAINSTASSNSRGLGSPAAAPESGPESKSLTERLTGHTDYVIGVSFSSDGSMLVSCSHDRSMKVWSYSRNGRTRVLTTLKGHSDSVYGCAVSSSGLVAASASHDSDIKLWSLDTMKEIRVLFGHDGPVRCCAFDNKGLVLASGSYDKTARLWSGANGDCLAVLEGHKGFVRAVSFSKDATHLVTGSDDKTARVWDVSNPKSPTQVSTLKHHSDKVSGCCYSSNGALLALASYDNSVSLWTASTYKLERILPAVHSLHAYSVTFSHDSTQIATTGDDNMIGVWDVSTGGQVAGLRGHHAAVMDVSFSPKQRVLASASHDSTICLWDLHQAEADFLSQQQGGAKKLEEDRQKKEAAEQARREAALRKVYQEFDLDGGGDVGDDELLVLGQTRRKLGQKSGSWTKGMNDSLMAKIGTDKEGNLPMSNFVKHFNDSLPGDSKEFDGVIEQFMDLSLIHISEPTRLLSISYAVFCLKKKKKKKKKERKRDDK
eukprot:TRINITY_DN4209_c0_g2_i2.p1 TRINITY_DN4209_c0_g2~~TRINITY_DN4209_c0_g2_i2.p1  ORF type:complete len:528 (-),score=129.65 TRINITY_DN4209_c0_g2_i2:53-1636(-)